jgi:glyoxylase-like metal-dependent hydrolase (beta-lactamase superfamily II)
VTEAVRDDWTTPGAYPVAPGVHRIPLPLPTDGLRAVNVYAIEDTDGLTLIDAGWAIEAARTTLDRALAEIGHTAADARRFLVTHVHRDHYTQAVLLRREFGSRIAMGKDEEPNLARAAAHDPQDESSFTVRLRVADAGPIITLLDQTSGDGTSDRTVWEQPDEWLADGAVTAVGDRSLVAVQTPGHTQGHLVFRDEVGGLLYAGDHVLPHITPSIGFEAAPADFPLRDYLDSLKLVRAAPDLRLLPAHGPVTDSAHARVDALLEHHDHRLAEIEAFVAQGASTGYEVAGRMRWTRRAHRLSDLDPFNAMLAVLETVSHLDVLVLQGRATVTVDGEVNHYAAR